MQQTDGWSLELGVQASTKAARPAQSPGQHKASRPAKALPQGPPQAPAGPIGVQKLQPPAVLQPWLLPKGPRAWSEPEPEPELGQSLARAWPRAELGPKVGRAWPEVRFVLKT